jgi:phospholipid/cholesterol/gamma-HCH transport system substrate-binding protein
VRSSSPTLDAAVPFVRQVRGLVSEPELRGLSRDLRPVVPPLTTLEKRSVPLYEQVRAASSCQTGVVLPWSRDRIEDKAFPALGPVYEEATKPLPGLAGESRSGDANGQWFRVMVAAPKFAYPFGTDKFFFTDNPIQGVNPPVPQGHKRSPLRPDVPCETQQAPDLRTIPENAPNGFPLTVPTADQLMKPLEDTVAFLRTQIKQQGLDLKVSDVPAKLQELTR